MKISSSFSMPFDEDPDFEGERSVQPQTQSTTPGGRQEIKWEVVAKTAGLAPAEIMAQRLQVEGIPARAWQEGAGQAIGLTVGLLGTGYVMVPETYLEQAKEILAQTWEDDEAQEDSPADDV